MSLKIYPWGVCRTPVYPLNSDMGEIWHELKKFISYSSSSFYNLLDECPENFDALSEKARFTLWKYFNRARFRATPYGEFAAFSLIPIHLTNKPVSSIIITPSLTTHRFQNWTFTPDRNSETFSVLKSNSSFYRVGDEIRYLKNEKDVFYLDAVEHTPLISRVLIFCSKERRAESVYSFLLEKMNLSITDARYFIRQLIEEQLLYTDMHSNIIGTDYFNRVGLNANVNERPYLIAERKVLSGVLSVNNGKALLSAIQFISRNIKRELPEDLKRFKRDFSRRYETKLMPLLTALDPEVGIGYGDHAEEAGEEQLINRLQKVNKPGEIYLGRSIFTNLDYFILNQIQLGVFAIDLREYKETVEVALHEDRKYSLPNTFAALIEVIDESIFLKSIGGASASSLSGRFTLASQELQKIMKSLVKIEEDANPDVLFFDIAYSGEKKVDNINRRASIYNYELPILSWSTTENVVDINDLYITVRGGELILYSKKYNKRVVPRLATAYNYTRSDLALFRFLTDLQHEGVQSNLTYDIQDVLPNLDFYPRVVYDCVILTPAKWRVPKTICDIKNGKGSLTYALDEVTAWLSKVGVGKYFICKEGDQTLLFCKDILDDIKAFIMYVSGKKNVYIEEGFMATNNAVLDDSGKPYKAEFVLNFWHDQKIYNPYESDFLKTDEYAKELFLPGDQWLYYELYCHPIRANELLLHCIQPFVEAYKDVIVKWFFIRYNDPSYHIRFRLELNCPGNSCSINSAFNEAIEEWIKSKKISEIKIKPYYREIERYGAARIVRVEEYFYRNSEFILNFLLEEDDPYNLYMITMQFIECTLAYVGYDIEQQLDFSKKMADIYAEEHRIEKEGFKIINSDYNTNFRARKDDAASLMDTQEMHLLILKAGELIRACEKDKRDGLAADLFHMHVNRLFHTEGRMHELIVYQFLSIKLKRMVKSKISR